MRVGVVRDRGVYSRVVIEYGSTVPCGTASRREATVKSPAETVRYVFRAGDVASRVGGMNSRTYVRSQQAPVARSSRQVVYR